MKKFLFFIFFGVLLHSSSPLKGTEDNRCACFSEQIISILIKTAPEEIRHGKLFKEEEKFISFALMIKNDIEIALQQYNKNHLNHPYRFVEILARLLHRDLDEFSQFFSQDLLKQQDTNWSLFNTSVFRGHLEHLLLLHNQMVIALQGRPSRITAFHIEHYPGALRRKPQECNNEKTKSLLQAACFLGDFSEETHCPVVKVGDHVCYRWQYEQGGRNFYTAQITRVYDGGSFDLLYDDDQSIEEHRSVDGLIKSGDEVLVYQHKGSLHGFTRATFLSVDSTNVAKVKLQKSRRTVTIKTPKDMKRLDPLGVS